MAAAGIPANNRAFPVVVDLLNQSTVKENA